MSELHHSTKEERFPWPWWKRLFHRHRWSPVHHSWECLDCGAMSYD